MLVETKAVVQMALLFGSTWTVNTVVFAAILVMSLAGNLFAGRVNPKRLEPYYIGLVAAAWRSGWRCLPKRVPGYGGRRPCRFIGACLLVFAPIAFAGVIFFDDFPRARTAQPDRALERTWRESRWWGGWPRTTSVILGFQLLLCVAVGFYLLSAVFGNRALPDSAAEKKV